MMETSMKLSRKKRERMLEILQGKVPVNEITDKEMQFLQERIMEGIAVKRAEAQQVVFREHRTLQ